MDGGDGMVLSYVSDVSYLLKYSLKSNLRMYVAMLCVVDSIMVCLEGLNSGRYLSPNPNTRVCIGVRIREVERLNTWRLVIPLWRSNIRAISSVHCCWIVVFSFLCQSRFRLRSLVVSYGTSNLTLEICFFLSGVTL